MIRKKIFKIAILMVGVLGIGGLIGCHATQSGYLYDDNYYLYPPNYYAYYPYPYYYPNFFFGTDILIIRSDGQTTGDGNSNGLHGRILRSDTSTSDERGLNTSSSTKRRALD